MRLTMMSDYAMRVLMYVAQQNQRLSTIAEIADAYGISEAHLMKVTHQLAQRGWIETVRGRSGGMRLAHAPQDIGLGAVVRSMEPDFRLVECLGSGSRCVLTGACALTGILSGALDRFLEHLDRYTLADILPPPATGRSGRGREHPLQRMVARTQ